jgi:hypothetical protein
LLKEKVEALLNTLNELVFLQLSINPSEVTTQRDKTNIKTSTVSVQQTETQSPALQD